MIRILLKLLLLFLILNKYIDNSIVVTNIVILILSPYAASILLLVLKNNTTELLHINSIIFTVATYTCPFNSVGYLIINLGNKFNFIASEINVNDPVIKTLTSYYSSKCS